MLKSLFYLLVSLPFITAFTNITQVILPENTIFINEEIGDDLITKTIGEMYSVKSDDIYFYINSNGGSVHSGNRLVEQMTFMKLNNKIIHCIGHKVISMAFVIFQHCSHRYSLHSSIAMQHQMSLMLGGGVENINTFFKMIKTLYKDLVVYQANKLNMDVVEFREKIKIDWWTYGKELVEYNISDKLVSAGCKSIKQCPFV